VFALEQGDVDRAAGVVQIRRAYANGRVKQTKTRLSRRAVPLQAIAVDALDQLQPRGVATAGLHRRSIPVAGIPDEKGDSGPPLSPARGMTVPVER
jgi:hypothetical protein